jgi:hypothetical protein
MASKVRSRLTYANVMATIAVFIALGGASYAALRIPARSVGSKQLKLQSVGPNHLKPRSVGPVKLKPGAVGAMALQEGAVGETALQEQSVGPFALQANAVNSDQIFPGAVGSRELKDFSVARDDLDPSAAAPRLFAHVNSSGTLGEQAGVASAGRSSQGQYFVDFNRNLQGCVAVATVGFGFGPGVIGAGATAQARMNLNNDASRVGVTIFRLGYTFNDVHDSDFHVIVAC